MLDFLQCFHASNTLLYLHYWHTLVMLKQLPFHPLEKDSLQEHPLFYSVLAAVLACKNAGKQNIRINEQPQRVILIY